MDELLSEFITESREHIDGAESQLLRFEKEPTDARLIAGIFRLVHTIKGTAGFVGLDRLQIVAHAAETVIGDLRDGACASERTISLVLAAIDRIKWLLAEVDRLGEEPDGQDDELITALAASAKDSGLPSNDVQKPNLMSDEALVTTSKSAVIAEKPSDLVIGPKEGAASRSKETIRVTVGTIESIMQLVSELVLTRNQLVEQMRRHEIDAFKVPLQTLSNLTTDLQDAVMRARMQPVGRLYSNLPRLVRELASELGKKLTLTTDGADTEIDRQLIDVIRDPLTHLIRNCADHGIESMKERVAAGKSEIGEIRVSASHQAGHITISIADDGRGLNLEKIAAKVISSGRATADEVQMFSFDELAKFIFEPGLSTASAVSKVSGRGVGMDVVRSNIESIGGTVSITSKPGSGTMFVIRIPLTLAIAPALIVEVSGQKFALPQLAVVEVLGLGEHSTHVLERVQKALILNVRENILPAIELSDLLGLESRLSVERLAVILKVGGTSFAIIVDDVLDVQEIVVKPMGASIAHIKVFSGQTILGDGAVVLILDPGGMAAQIGIENAGERLPDTAKLVSDKKNTQLMIVFRAGPGALKVLPLSVVARIETISAEQLSLVDGRLVMMRQSRLMPVVAISSTWSTSKAAVHVLLVVGQSDQAVGLLVDEVTDIIQQEVAIQISSSAIECIGVGEIRGEPVEFLDVSHYLQIGRVRAEVAECRGTVLLASNDQGFSDLVSPTLIASGYRVHSINQLLDGPRMIAQSPSSDVVLIDMDMGDEARCHWIDALCSMGLVPDRLLGLYTQNLMRLRSREIDAVSRIFIKAERRQWLDALEQIFDVRKELSTARSCKPTQEWAA